MNIFKETIQTMIVNATNACIEDHVDGVVTDSNSNSGVDLASVDAFVNASTPYFMNRCGKKGWSGGGVDSEERGSVVESVLADKPLSLVGSDAPKAKGRGRPKKPEIDKLMISVMSLITKYMEKEKAVVTGLVTKNFELSAAVPVAVPTDVTGPGTVPSQPSSTVVCTDDVADLLSSLSIGSTPHPIQPPSPIAPTHPPSIPDALIKAAAGVSVENAQEIQDKLASILIDEDEDDSATMHIEVDEIMLDGTKYYIDDNGNLYDCDTNDIVGTLDKKTGHVCRM